MQLCHGDIDRAEDLVQSALSQIACDFGKFDAARAGFCTWAHLLLFRTWGDQKRIDARWMRDLALTLPARKPPFATESEALDCLSCEEWMAPMTPRKQAVLRLRMDGYTLREMAVLMHCDQTTISREIREMQGKSRR